MGIVKQIIEERELSFWDHLDVLRWLLFRVICAWVILSVGFFIIMPDFFDKIILAPCYNDFVFYDFLRWIGQQLHLSDPFFTQDEFEVHLQNINLASQFFTHITTSFLMAVVVTAPYLVYEIWRFVRPALYPNELKGVRKAFSLGTVFFFIGVAVGYFMIFPLALRFLSTYQLSVAIENEISLTSYIDNFMMLVLMMGVAFELPLVTWLLSLIGLVTRSFLREYRKHAFLLIVIFAAVITPTGDPFTLSAVSLPLYLLYELSIFMVKEDKDEDEEEEETKEEEAETSEGKENKLVENKTEETKALPSKDQEVTATEDDSAPVDGENISDAETSEEVKAATPAPTTMEFPEESEFTPESEGVNLAAPEMVEYEDEYYMENDMVQVRQVPKEKPVDSVAVEETAKPVDSVPVEEAGKTADTISSETSAKVYEDGVAPYEKLYVRPEDQFVDGGDESGYMFQGTPPIDPYAPYKEVVERPATVSYVAPQALEGLDYLEAARVEARAAQKAADAAAQMAQNAANEALEAAKRANEAAEEAIRKAEAVLKEMERRKEEEELKKAIKPIIDVSKIRYDIDSLPPKA